MCFYDDGFRKVRLGLTITMTVSTADNCPFILCQILCWLWARDLPTHSAYHLPLETKVSGAHREGAGRSMGARAFHI